MSQATIFSRIYTADLDLNNKKSNDELLGEEEVHSKITCAVMCQKECSVFGYNPVMKKCRTHKTIFTSNVIEEAGWRYFYNDFLPIDCKDFRDNGHTNTGVYEIYPFGTTLPPIRVYCDMDTLDGGWTGKNSSLYVSITLSNGTALYQLYNQFSISDEADKYQLFLAGPTTGTLGDSMLNTGYSWANLLGMYFSTPDRDNDKWTGGNCATISNVRGGWWFNVCHLAFLNGQWSPGDWGDPWDPINIGTSVVETMMLIRRY
ncbi:fibroleukin-like [Saccostrea cucullata]|uniref:fibroleukin-like n=1 Tax=Saccostrea cuccullata TaxID=36930 RepID=UPI002ED3BADE